MLAKRIIPCLDVKDGKVVKGIRFRNHKIVGDVVALAEFYSRCEADELVFYDITASSEFRQLTQDWVRTVARSINIPFCVAGGIRTLKDAETLLKAGADKISINSPALENPDLIDKMVAVFGKQCIVVGIDSQRVAGDLMVFQYTGSEKTSQCTSRKTVEWVKEVQDRGAGEIVLNCMNFDGVAKGYDIEQLKQVRAVSKVPLIVSGGAGSMSDFQAVFNLANVDGALAASVFHSGKIEIRDLKRYLLDQSLSIRPPTTTLLDHQYYDTIKT